MDFNGNQTVQGPKDSFSAFRTLFLVTKNCIEPFKGSKYVALTEPFKILYRTFSKSEIKPGLGLREIIFYFYFSST